MKNSLKLFFFGLVSFKDYSIQCVWYEQEAQAEGSGTKPASHTTFCYISKNPSVVNEERES